MSTIEKKYTRLRDRLDTFGYKAPLGVESIPLGSFFKFYFF